jgi:hypothetical protein
LAALIASSLNGSMSAGAEKSLITVRGSAPVKASSISFDNRSASVGACVEMMIVSGLSCAAVAVSSAS